MAIAQLPLRGRFDDLGLRRVLGDRMLPLLVAAMAFLAALALAGSVGAALLARHWQEGAAAALTVQVPQPNAPAADNAGSRIDRVVTLLRGTPGIASATALTDAQLADLLRPDRISPHSAPGSVQPRPARWWRATAFGSADSLLWRAACKPVPGRRWR